MSWSVTYLGTPDKICDALNKYSESLSGQSKNEFDEASPHIKSLLLQNVGASIFRLNASGHAQFNSEGNKTSGYCAVNIEQIYGLLV